MGPSGPGHPLGAIAWEGPCFQNQNGLQKLAIKHVPHAPPQKKQNFEFIEKQAPEAKKMKILKKHVQNHAPNKNLKKKLKTTKT